MSIGKSNLTDPKAIRDIDADYIAAYRAEHDSYRSAGLDDRAKAVAEELRRLGHEVRPTAAGAKETAVSPEPLETAVEADAAPKRRGRPRRTE